MLNPSQAVSSSSELSTLIKRSIDTFVATFVLTVLVQAQAELRFAAVSTNTNDELGAAVASVGDVNGDGRSDVVVGAPFDTTGGVDAGRAYVYSGADGSILYTFQGTAGQWLGHSVSGGVDCNADGVPDIVVGLANDSTVIQSGGSIRIYSGATGALLAQNFGSGTTHRLGYNCGVVGDVNGDGKADIVVGAPGSAIIGGFAGYARLVSGANGATLWQWNGIASLDRFGYTVSGAGDVDNDNVPDVVVGAIGVDGAFTNMGRIHVYSGATGLQIFAKSGDGMNHEMGHGVSTAGDLNGDGYDDVFATANYRSGTSYSRVYSGFDGSVLLQITGDGTQGFGHSASIAGDVNCDGVQDFIVGLPSDDSFMTNAGRANIYSGVDASLLASYHGTGSQQRYGYFVAPAGDTNGDGFADVIVGTSFSGTVPSYVHVLSDVAVEKFNAGMGGTQTINADFLAGPSTNPTLGSLDFSGAAPAAFGVLAASLTRLPTPQTFAQVSVLIDVDPSVCLYLQVMFDAVGHFAQEVDLRQPAIDGLSLFVQMFEVNGAAPGGIFASNGVELLFCR